MADEIQCKREAVCGENTVLVLHVQWDDPVKWEGNTGLWLQRLKNQEEKRNYNLEKTHSWENIQGVFHFHMPCGFWSFLRITFILLETEYGSGCILNLFTVASISLDSKCSFFFILKSVCICKVSVYICIYLWHSLKLFFRMIESSHERIST